MNKLIKVLSGKIGNLGRTKRTKILVVNGRYGVYSEHLLWFCDDDDGKHQEIVSEVSRWLSVVDLSISRRGRRKREPERDERKEGNTHRWDETSGICRRTTLPKEVTGCIFEQVRREWVISNTHDDGEELENQYRKKRVVKDLERLGNMWKYI